MTKPFRTSLCSIVAINIDLMTAAGCGFVAWAIWPSTPEWWGLGVMSVLLAIAALTSLIKALREMIALHRKQRVIDAYLAQGSAPKASRLATLDDLKRAGMLDD